MRVFMANGPIMTTFRVSVQLGGLVSQSRRIVRTLQTHFKEIQYVVNKMKMLLYVHDTIPVCCINNQITKNYSFRCKWADYGGISR